MVPETAPKNNLHKIYSDDSSSLKNILERKDMGLSFGPAATTYNGR